MKKEFYRFRPIKRLIGEEGELNNQEIYFAHHTELNDPMEGYRDIVWSGDEIIWRNFFRHYVYCLQHITTLFLIAGGEQEFTKDDIPVLGSIENLPTEKSKEIFYRIYDTFIESKNINGLIHSISTQKKPLRRNELEFYLDTIHPYALKVIFDIFIEEELSPKSNRIPDFVETSIENLHTEGFFEALKSVNDTKHDHFSTIFSLHNRAKEQLFLITKYKSLSSNKNKSFLLMEFPYLYIKSLERICFPAWYAACFMSKYSNSSVWGHYGENHTGACLIFNAEEDNDKSFIRLKGINGWSSTAGETHGWFNLEFKKIDYKSQQESIDFFRSMGSLPYPTLYNMWYMDKDGNRSSCAEKTSESEEEWRSSHWSNFYRDITTKSKDWKYESEYRLILTSFMIDLSEGKKRRLNYDFNKLFGIIFGINTTDENKISIMNIINKKCIETHRKDFKFYQAYFCFEDNCIKKYELNLLNFDGG